MSSKWIKQSVIAGAVMLLTVILVVVLGNWNTIKRRLGKKHPVVTQAETDSEIPGGQIGSDLTGFMRDESFFDGEPDNLDILMESGKKVSVMMDSIGQDLRIMVIDSKGALVTGTNFTAIIEKEGRFTDDNEDGVIYISHLREGQYFVSLDQAEGFIVPATKTMINISKDIEYKALSDVAYLVINEDDIDVTKEDTSDKLAITEADGTESIDLDTYETNGKIGIDVSRYNREIDWETVADTPVEFAIIRCGYRGASSGSLILDSTFKDNMMGASKAGIPVGVYFFSQAITEAEAIEEASMVIDKCKLFLLDYPIFIDSESAGGKGRADKLSKEDRTAIVKAFCETVANSGYEAGVYASANWWNENLDADKLTHYHSWLAQYKDVPDYEGYYDFWQYTSKGSVDGIDTKVDLNVFYSR